MNILVVKFNLPELEEKCIESVKKHTDLTKHTLTVYDNYPKKENLAVVWNRLIEESEDENICLLNSDTLVEKDWTRLEENIRFGAVGPITNNCGGKQKHLEKKDIVEGINDLSGFCYCFTKKVWEEVGRFPEDMPFYGQETVFNRKIERAGYKLLVDRRVFVYHFKGQSWLKAKNKGEINDNNRKYGAMHYNNFVERLKKVPKKSVVILGAGKGNPFPTFIGIDQFVSDFGGKHLSMDATIEEIGDPDILIVVQTRYNKDWWETIKNCRAKKKVLYFMDLRTPEEWNGDASIFDKVFLCAKGYVKKWQDAYGVPVEWLPQATIQQLIPPTGEHYKMVHIGGLSGEVHENRREILKDFKYAQINEEDRDKRAEVVERQWGIYGSSDYSLAISPAVEGYTSDRLYHIMGSGGRALALNPGGLNHLDEYVTWIGKDNEIDREKTFEYAQTNHTYKDRIIKILNNAI